MKRREPIKIHTYGNQYGRVAKVCQRREGCWLAFFFEHSRYVKGRSYTLEAAAHKQAKRWAQKALEQDV